MLRCLALSCLLCLLWVRAPVGDREGIAALRVARLLRDLNDEDGAREYYEAHLNLREEAGVRRGWRTHKHSHRGSVWCCCLTLMAPCTTRMCTIAGCQHHRLCRVSAVPCHLRQGAGATRGRPTLRHASAGLALRGACCRGRVDVHVLTPSPRGKQISPLRTHPPPPPSPLASNPPSLPLSHCPSLH